MKEKKFDEERANLIKQKEEVEQELESRKKEKDEEVGSLKEKIEKLE